MGFVAMLDKMCESSDEEDDEPWDFAEELYGVAAFRKKKRDSDSDSDWKW